MNEVKPSTDLAITTVDLSSELVKKTARKFDGANLIE